MRFSRAVTLFALVAGGVTVLTSCSVNALVWGSDGARVIDATEQLIGDVAANGGSTLVCADAEVELGVPADWVSRSAGEPERFTGDFWADQVPLDPQWGINLEGLPDGVSPGDRFPGDVFYREGEDELCVIDISWSTLAVEG